MTQWQNALGTERENGMKVLIVEDERKTGTYLQQGLTEAGYTVDLATDGVEGLHQALTGHHDLVVLDVMLPNMDGWQILETLRRGGRDMPVLFLTARDQVEDRVRGLELGADDYLVKPFAFSELLARVCTLLRRGRSSRNRPRCGSPIWSWICSVIGRPGRGSASISPPRNSRCSNYSCAAGARCCRAR